MIFGVSLKTYLTPSKAKQYLEDLVPVLEHCQKHNIDFFVIPDLVSLSVVHHPLPHGAILGAQDTFHEDNGAFTGTVSPSNLAEVGVKMVEIGHAERRRLFGETDHDVAQKVTAAVRNGITPLICIGELERDDSDGQSHAVDTCVNQITKALHNVDAGTQVVVAYEPVWAIGKPQPAPAQYVINVANGIKQAIQHRKSRVIYGGSAGPGLFNTLHPAVDGLFLGRFGHDTSKVMDVINEAINCTK